MTEFSDHFSAVAADYRANRPTYPRELFAWLAAQTPHHRFAWDAATGNGQAAVMLADHFDRVIATDASVEQIAHAEAKANVTYAVSQSCLATSVDLVTVCQALHWFDLDAFYAEVRRVLNPGGLLAVVGYRGHRVNAAIDAVLDRFEELIGPYWPPQRQILEDGYRSIPFPFREITPPHFDMCMNWDCGTHLGYLRTWSAAKEYRERHGVDLVDEFANDFVAAWGNDTRAVTWDLVIRCGS